MAFDTDKLRSHLKESGLFSDAEIEAEVLSAQKDAKAEERRTILNTQKVEAPAVAQSSPAIAAAPVVSASAAAPSVAPVRSAPPITSATTPAELFDMRPKGTPVERIGGMIGEAGTAAATTGQNATQSSLDYARETLANDPYLPAKVLFPLGVGYGIKKAADAGLFSDLGSKIAAKFGAASNQPQPFVGGSGPRVTPQPDQMAGSYWDWANKQPGNQASGSPSAGQPQAWDIHGEPALFAPTPAATTEAPPAAPSQNLSLTEATDRMKNVTPAAGEFVGPMQPVGPPEFTGPRRPVVPTPPAALASTTAPVAPVVPPTGELKTGAGLPAYAGEGKQYQRMPKEFPSVKEVPAGYAFVPGVGPGTNTIRNLETPEGYKAAVQLHGGPFGSHDEAVAFMNKYNDEQRMGPPADRALRKSLGLPLQENTKGIPMKIAKVGGVVGAIMALPELANAGQSATQGKYGEAVGQTLGVASSFISPVAQFLAHIGNAGESPEEQARFERQRDYALKAGRGVAQGYDPRKLIGVAPPTR